MTIKVDYDKALELLQNAVNEKGADYVYPEEEKQIFEGCAVPICAYSFEGGPSCIAGNVGHQLGVLDKMIEGEPASTALSDAGVTLTTRARSLLNNAQDFQDNGLTWGEAVNKAQKIVVL